MIDDFERGPGRAQPLKGSCMEPVFTGLKPGGKFYANFYRHSPNGPELLAWTPPFESGFHSTGRLAEFTLQ